jgi:hypothetical protein
MPDYLLTTGRLGDLGLFRSASDLRRGGQAVVRTARGLEVGTVLREATPLLARLLPEAPPRDVLRPLTEEDSEALRQREETAAALVSRAAALGVTVLDAEVLFDGAYGVLYHLGAEAEALRSVVRELSRAFRLTLGTESLAEPPPSGGCGGCGSGCGSCGATSADDVRAYFAGLRDGMERRGVPLL